MTLPMPDAVNVNDLPVGYPAYLGYTDGSFKTANQLRSLFPDARLVLLTVTGTGLAHGARVSAGEDTEPGDLTAASAALWAAEVIRHGAAAGPLVMYASVIGAPGYGMRDLVDELLKNGVQREQVKLLSAHYGEGEHICGPDTCDAIEFPMDGTQWTNQFRTPAGAVIDMSVLRDDFFGAPPAPVPVLTETERIVRELGIVRQGDQGPQVRTVQALCAARGRVLAIDGVFGPKTVYAVETCQHNAGITADGIVGPKTWPVLLGVAP